MEVRYFGRLREQLNIEVEQVSLPDNISDASTLRTWLASTRYNGTCLLDQSVRVIVNEEIVTWEHTVTETDSIAFIPPVSGG
ncbi:molybdopterin converting factor subunit 1 [Parvularcula sp. IMCC14364]|uniref:molybdopterin converting factor subunit 1 n=1 Tax=Parvularcula sp. IMCC14364 TaxID=3067902 RepID=UPI003558A891